MIIHRLPHVRSAGYHRLFETMFEDRRRQFVDLLGWNVPVIEGRFEVDSYDGNGATYIVATDDEARHAGSLRLLPSHRPHVFADLFAELSPFGVPRDPETAEITRLCLPTRLGTAGRLSVRNRLISAMVDHALAAGLTRLTGVVSARFRRDVLAMGWLAEPLGPERAIGGSPLGAFMLHLGPDTPERLRWTGIYVEEAERRAVAIAPAATGVEPRPSLIAGKIA